ncbi:hypothetical protein LI90_688 [Carbonactinospora thermoautotrophica]|uniref:EVE domain-containing protein n=3 Tax=Carbonactinospora thermoautotrophica TaxID=1469144 RepID=A0A132MMH1_9ACTN|nr:hypothetical protein LI90_688 [Carbonactinospora thermoautotrophica]
MIGMSGTYLLILGHGEAVAWVLREQRMAFPARRHAEVSRLEPGDELLVYATRGAWNNPTRDRGRVIARATVASPVTVLDPPVTVAGREFASGCRIRVTELAPFGGGVELAPLVPELAAFPDPASWSVRLRRPLLALPEQDAARLRGLLAEVAGTREEHLAGYLEHATGPRAARAV